MNAKKNAITFHNLKTGKEFAGKRKLLMTSLSKGASNKESIDTCLHLAWLHDQWALVSTGKNRGKKQELAEHYFTEAKKRGAEEQRILNGLGTLALHKEDHRQALAYYLKAHNIKKNFSTHNALGNVYRRLKNWNKSEMHYKAAVRLAKNADEKASPLFNLIQLADKDLPIGVNAKERKIKTYRRALVALSKKSDIAKMLLDRLVHRVSIDSCCILQ